MVMVHHFFFFLSLHEQLRKAQKNIVINYLSAQLMLYSKNNNNICIEKCNSKLIDC